MDDFESDDRQQPPDAPKPRRRFDPDELPEEAQLSLTDRGKRLFAAISHASGRDGDAGDD